MQVGLTSWDAQINVAVHVRKRRAGNASPSVRRRNHGRALSAAFSMVGCCGSPSGLPLPTGGLANPLHSATRLQAGRRVQVNRRRPDMPKKYDSRYAPCAFPGCDRPSNIPGTAKGFCGAHYRRLKLYGDPAGEAAKRIGPVQEWVQNVAVTFASDECLIWPFARSCKGYAIWTVGGRPQMAHRVIFEMAGGPPPSADHVAAHNCFNGAGGCVNPLHIRWATQSENEMDKVTSGTSNRGARHGMSKLTEEDVQAIRKMAGLKTQGEIARQFNISKWTVGDIIRRKRWGWLA